MSEPNDVQELIREIGDLAEAIRLILVPHLDEPERRAFWNAVKIRDLARSPTLAALSARIEGLEKALEPFARVAQNIPESTQDKDVTRVVMDEILTTEQMDNFAKRGAPVRDAHVELILSLDGLRAKHFRAARAALSPIPAEPR